MPSLFSRASLGGSKREKRPTNVLLPEQAQTVPSRIAQRPFVHPGEFGAILNVDPLPTTPSSPIPSPGGAPLLPPKYIFLPTSLPPHPPTINSVDSFAYGSDDVTARRDYGFLGAVGKDVVLGLDEVARVIRDVGAELGTRGLATPLLFSNQALELNQTRTKALIQTYISTIPMKTRVPLKTKIDAYQQDLRFAREYELAWLLRWALSRMTRMREGTRELCHGCIEWEVYEEWRGRERAANYPADAFPYLSSLLPSDVYYHIIAPLFSLLTRLAAHSHLSGLTPHALSSLFAPLLFDIPANSTCMTAHTAFVRAACATEHLILSHVRSSGRRDGLGVSDLPSRLQEWIKGYPAMVASDAQLAHAHPRKGARVVRCHASTRTVRAYSRDLVVTAELWADDVPGGWVEWQRVLPTSGKKRGEASRPKFSAAWRKRMCVKETLPLPPSAESSMEGTRYGLAVMPGVEEKGKDRVRRREEEDGDEGRFESLAGKEWSAFEEGGFDAPTLSLNLTPAMDIRRKLEFDLNESAKLSLAERRQTMDWTAFAGPDGGFNRTDPFLTASLTFSAPVEETIYDWPKERDELRRRLQKSQKESTPFAYKTSPCVGGASGVEGGDEKGRVWLEEAFIDCWADLMMGCAWAERDELTFKEANWAVIEYRARPSRPEEDAPHPFSDPRTTEMYFLFEERVPADYQMAVADPKRKTTLSNLFSSRKKKQGSMDLGTDSPVSPVNGNKGMRSDFDRMLLTRRQPKKLALSSRNDNPSASVWHMVPEHPSPTSPVARIVTRDTTAETARSTTPRPPPRPRTRSDDGGHGKRNRQNGSDESAASAERAEGKKEASGGGGGGGPKFLRSMRRVKSNSDNREKARRQRETEMDFEIVSASGASSGGTSPNDGRVKSPDDKWMDILMANGAKRMDRQDASMPRSKSAPKQVTSIAIENEDQATPTIADFQPVPESELDRSGLRESHNRTPSPTGHEDSGPHHFGSPMSDDSHRFTDEQDQLSDEAGDADGEGGSPTYPGRTGGGGSGGYGLRRGAGGRDTIHSVVERYRDSSASTMTASSTNDSGFSILDEDDLRHPQSSRSESEGRIGIVSPDPHHVGQPRSHLGGVGGGGGGEEGDEGSPTLLNPMFDLTPGREPSPARYKHGEPLQLVGEEEEEEEAEY